MITDIERLRRSVARSRVRALLIITLEVLGIY